MSLKERLGRAVKKKLLLAAAEMEQERGRSVERRCERDLRLVRQRTLKASQRRRHTVGLPTDAGPYSAPLNVGHDREAPGGFQAAANKAKTLLRQSTLGGEYDNNGSLALAAPATAP